MFVKVSDIPESIKPFKVLHYSKIKGKVYDIDGFPKDGEVLDPNKHQVKNKEKLISFCHQLVKTGIKDGVGICATQVGIYKRLFAIKQDEFTWKIYFHPTWKSVGEEKEIGLEGCLSCPGIGIFVPRFKKILVHYYELNDNFEIVESEDLLEEFKARVYLHESDHLLTKSIMDYATK